jgi:hypothetical protein
MKLFMSGGVEKSLKDFDEGLENYFSTSRRYRSSLRRGSIVLLDTKDNLFNFFQFLSEKCGLELGVIHVMNDANAKKAIEDLGIHKVKALVVDSKMLGESLNGDSLVYWIEKQAPRIPIWVVNCDKERKKWIRSQTINIGIIEKDASLSSLAETVGFPKAFENFIGDYVN